MLQKPGRGLRPILNPVRNPIMELDNLISYFDLTNQNAYTFSSGVIIQSIAAKFGTINMENYNSPEYDSTAFGGLGGMKITTLNDAVRYDADFTTTATQTVGFICDIPDYAANQRIFAFGNGTNRSTNCAVLHYKAGGFSYQRNEVSASESFVNLNYDGVMAIILRFNDATSVDCFTNTLGSEYNLDPLVDYSTYGRLYLGETQGGNVGAHFGEMFHTSDVLSDEEIADILAYWNKRFFLATA